MSKKDNVKGYSKNVINWEITCCDKTSANVYFIRNFG